MGENHGRAAFFAHPWHLDSNSAKIVSAFPLSTGRLLKGEPAEKEADTELFFSHKTLEFRRNQSNLLAG
jgi:hypothetical protein